MSVNGSLVGTIAEEELRSELDIDEAFFGGFSGVLSSLSVDVALPGAGYVSCILPYGDVVNGEMLCECSKRHL